MALVWGLWLYGRTVDAPALAFLAIVATIITVTDFGFNTVPDRVSLPGIILGLSVAAVGSRITLLNSMIGASLGFVLFYLLTVGGKLVLKRDALGGGDIKLAAMLGACLGWTGLVLAVFMGSWVALSFVGARAIFGRIPIERQVPFGPFLMYAGVATFVWGGAIVEAYLRLCGLR